jgi:hypothetical protein
MPGITEASTEVLLVVRANLLRGLDEVARHVDAGTFALARAGGAAPPSEAGWVTLVLLGRVEDELSRRSSTSAGPVRYCRCARGPLC